MKVRVTVMYDYGDKSLMKETADFDIEEDDTEAALEHLNENLLEPYGTDGHPLENDPEEITGGDFLAIWILADPLDSRDEAVEFIDQLIEDAEAILGDL